MNTWIFQGNPERFRVIELLKDGFKSKETIRWGIRQEWAILQISENDLVYIWKSRGTQVGDLVGIVAYGKIKTRPRNMMEDRPDLVIDLPENAIGVEIEIIEMRLNRREGMLERDEIRLAMPDLRILKVPMETNYLLTDQQAEKLEEMWNAKRR